MKRRAVVLGLAALVGTVFIAVGVEAFVWRRDLSRRSAPLASDDGGVPTPASTGTGTGTQTGTGTGTGAGTGTGTATVRGSVVDENGRPVAGAVVEVAAEGGDSAGLDKIGELGVLRGRIPYPPPQPTGFATRSTAAARSDAYGNFLLASVPEGRVVVSASHAALMSGVSEPLVLVAGKETRVTVTLRRGAALSGRVVDERGNPVAGAHVEVVIQPSPRSADSDASGAFVVAGIDSGAHEVVVTHADFAPATYREVAAGADLAVTLSPGGGIDGFARDARTGGVPLGLVLTLTAAGGRPRVLPLDNGHFRATALPAGKATLAAVAPGYVTLTRSLDIPAGGGLHEVTVRDLALELARGGSVSACVRDDRGDRVVGVELKLGPRSAVTHGDGCARLDGVAAGRVRVSVEKDGLAAAEEIEVRADEESRVELRLR